MIKIVDVHTHTFPEKISGHAIKSLSEKSHTKPFTDGTINALKSSMIESGVTCSIIQPVATKPEQVMKINDSAIRINSEGSVTGIYSFGAIHPDFDGHEKELTRISEAGIKGVKIHPVYQGVEIDDERYINILRISGELGLTVMIHAGYDIGFPGNDYALPFRILKSLESSGNVRVILAHMGGWKCWNEAAEIFSGREGVFFDTAFSLGYFSPNGDGYYSNIEDCRMLNNDDFVGMIKKFGSERVLFGTDSPWASQSESLESFMSLELNEREKNMILHENVEKLLAI